jgi:hypothetical protein
MAKRGSDDEEWREQFLPRKAQQYGPLASEAGGGDSNSSDKGEEYWLKRIYDAFPKSAF